ncbi:MAG TPA: ribosome recycling factor [Candidatus Pacebacteria bacterium]|nr:ribosome recycling factor [Candidatus Paceibacterota bacterium]
MSIVKSLYETKFTKAYEFYLQDIAVIRTGRASAQILDGVRVEAYGAVMKLNEVASVTVSDPTLIVITPWDRGLIGAIEKAIQVAQLNLSPIVDGQLIRLPVPAPTAERRQELVKQLHQKAENARVMIRNARIDVKKDIEKQIHQPGISEDDISAETKTLDEVSKTYIEKIDQATKAKETELTTL